MTAALRVPTIADILNYARTQLGVHEDPPGSNNVVYNTWYYGRRVSGASYPWCAVGVSYVADQVGAIAAGIIPRHAYTPSGAAWFKARNQWHSSPRVGDIVYYNIGGLGRISHCGIVESVYSDGSWIAIEFNTDVRGGRTGGQVMRQHRSILGAGGGFGRPAYGLIPAPGPISPAPVPPQPSQLVVDGDLGPATISRWQQIMGTPVDGVISRPVSSLIKAVQARLNATGARPQLVVDGDFGPGTTRALQGYLNHVQGPVSIDGELGPNTIRALQRRLNTGRF